MINLFISIPLCCFYNRDSSTIWHNDMEFLFGRLSQREDSINANVFFSFYILFHNFTRLIICSYSLYWLCKNNTGPCTYLSYI